MKPIGVIKIKKRTQPEWLIAFIIFMVFAFGTLLDLLRLPGTIKYVLDVVWILLILYMVLRSKYKQPADKNIRPLYLCVTALLIFTVFGYVVNYQSVLYYLWGLRNNFRFYVLFFAVVAFMRQSDAESYLSLFDKLLWANIAVSAVQYFLLDIDGDHLGGLFGTATGCNAYTNIFFVIISIKSIVFCLNKRESIKYCATKCVAMLLVAAFAELKFFYIEFILIIIMAVLITDFSWRKLLIIVGGLVAVFIGAYLLILVFPNSVGFLSLEGILKIAASDKGYTSSGDLNRLTAIPTISRKFLTTFGQKLTGMGLGNCDTANFDFLVTPFSVKYTHLRYQWFSVAFLYLETGFTGLFLFWGFFVLIILRTIKMQKTAVADRTYCQISAILAACCIMITFYNSTLRVEAGYLAYLVLAFPFLRKAECSNVPQEI